MAQKTKVKELVGRGLNSYHTKALQQIHRIEKKNKEQNHKISILSNELDNDYLTKTEEGSVISLEHSKEGMVYLDELQGNTLVNYCTDGSKELTLNGDIDVEGTFVTTTEGVDNGLVDVYCEGNTLVNLVNREWSYGATGTYKNRECYIVDKTSSPKQDIFTTKKGGTYTLIYDYASNTLTNGTTNPFKRVHLTLYNDKTWLKDIDVKNFESDKNEFTRNISVFTIPTDIDYTRLNMTAMLRDVDGTVWLDKDVILLEGDWSNKELPKYFEGMKSVGQDDENGHKIEILSQNGNLYNYDVHSKPYGNYLVSHKVESNGMKVKANNQDTRGCSFIRLYANEDLYISIDIVGNGSVSKKLADNTHIESYKKSNEKVQFKLEKGREYKIELNAGGIYDAEVLYDNIIISKNNYIDFIPRMFNKKEISLNEPLRGLLNGVCDRFVKQGGKWYVERNYGEVTLDGSENWSINSKNTIYYSNKVNNNKIPTSNNSSGYVPFLCNNLISTFIDDFYNTGNSSCIGISNSGQFGIGSSKFSNSEELKQWLQQNPTTVVYQLETPTYEEITDPNLITYLDTTHISNNSTIPCNMKIKNSGYNAIIKPNTKYTVAFDTNKSGTIGMNLGGAKVTTTNNVATITTPATLTDDSLRIYGKGIKGSKVRLLEGDKTNWIPSHFEGMKSSFEDKFDATDNTYKMEILSNNKNLFNINWTKQNSGNGVIYKISNNNIIVDVTDKADAWAGCYMPLVQLQPNTEYSIRCDRINGFGAYIIGIKDSGGSNVADFKEGMEYKSFVTPSNGIVQLRFFSHNTQQNLSYQTIFKNIVLCKGNKIVDYTEPKSNKIQFSSIEPLRGVNLRNGSYKKDRFVFIDNSLKIERNCKKIILDGSQDMVYNTNEDKNGTAMFSTRDITEKRPSYHVECDTFSSSGNNLMTTTNFADREGIGAWSSLVGFNIRIKTCKLNSVNVEGIKEYLRNNPATIIYPLSEPTYEEVPFELQKIILEGYENGTLFFDTNIPPTSTITYAGETPIVKSVKLNKTEVLNNTEDINDNIIPYLMDMDYRVVMLQLATEELEGGVSMARLFGGTYEMIKRDILSKRLTREEYGYRLADYYNVGKLTEEQVRELEELR